MIAVRHLTPWMRLFLACCLLGLAPATCGGPRDLERYPPRESSPYTLPYERGTARFCIQGNNGRVSHHGRGEFAWDFVMPTGTVVTAAREGVVSAVRVDSDRNATGDGRDNNYVIVRHADGSEGCYLHLKHEGSLVAVGQRVAQGEAIALSGNTGNSALPHLHFQVRAPAGATIPVTFRDVRSDGIPRTGRVYRAKGQE